MASFDEIAARLRGTSVPSIGSTRATTLDAALVRVCRAEAELATARQEARRIARVEGKKLDSLFEESLFVRRSSAETWCDEARAEGRAEGKRKAADEIAAALKPSPEFQHIGKFRHIAEALHRREVEGRVPGAARQRMGLEPLPPRVDPTPPPSAADLVQEQIRERTGKGGEKTRFVSVWATRPPRHVSRLTLRASEG